MPTVEPSEDCVAELESEPVNVGCPLDEFVEFDDEPVEPLLPLPSVETSEPDPDPEPEPDPSVDP